MYWLIAAIPIGTVLGVIVVLFIVKGISAQKYAQLQSEVWGKLGYHNWDIIPYFDTRVVVKSRQALAKYSQIKFFQEHREKLGVAEKCIKLKQDRARVLRKFLNDNEFQSRPQYDKIVHQIEENLRNEGAYRIRVTYISSAGNHLGDRTLSVTRFDLDNFQKNPFLLMSKGEYSKYIKERQKEELSRKQSAYYERVNSIIDYANENRDSLIIKGSQEQLDQSVAQLFDRTVNAIKRVKTVDSEEWDMIGEWIDRLTSDIKGIVEKNRRILDYYQSSDFLRIKESCEALMSSQREFNEYINGKIASVSQLFGTRVVRNDTVRDDEYRYVRPYKKTITPFTAEVSSAVFASAENSPLEYVVKYFYPNKSSYPDRIQKLYQLVEELETLRDARQIIENYKQDYQQYLRDVPDDIMENDEAGFYSRLGFANIDESVLVVEYRFSYTSDGGMAKRSFTVPMTEENIAELIKLLEGRLTASAFTKEQRNLMTRKLRDAIKVRDHFTCRYCANSTYKEPNLLLEIDHIIPVSKGGRTVEENLQTLCWKCNRAKGDRIAGQT